MEISTTFLKLRSEQFSLSLLVFYTISSMALSTVQILLILSWMFVCIACQPVPKNERKIVCYFYTNHKPYEGDLPPELDPTLCTHIIFIGTGIVNGIVKPGMPSDINMYYKKIPLLKKINPKVKVLLCNGGNFNDVLASAVNRAKYIKSALALLRKYGFDGFDLDFEFPAWYLPKEQKHNFTLLATELHDLFAEEAKKTNQTRLLLTAAVAAIKSITDASYEVPALAKVLDWINLMVYDLHAFAYYDPFTGFNSPLYAEPHDNLIYGNRSIVYSGNYWISKGMPKSKVVIGIPLYGHSYKLLFAFDHGLHAPASDRGPNDGYVNYPDSCQLLKSGATRVFHEHCKVPYMYKGKTWISYDDEQSIQIKVNWIKKNGYPGIMIYNMNADDYLGKCDGKTKFPLLKVVNQFRN